MKHIQSYNIFILEKKADVVSYPNFSDLGLIIKQTKRNGTTTISLTLYDFKDDVVMGHIELDNLKNKSNFEIMRACAKKDWGAVIYDFALMCINPLPVTPSNVIMPKAINIWKYYYDFFVQM